MAASVDRLDGFIHEMKIRFPDATARTFTPTASALMGAPFSDGGHAGTKPDGFES
jgi:hypothetical protein